MSYSDRQDREDAMAHAYAVKLLLVCVLFLGGVVGFVLAVSVGRLA